ncbi:major facilitator superfamily domain-containing protein [Sporodiniella umbellata]|nr:major facilitator superfamily domain-containing protein [Sporodiniella umbellata]
MHFSELDRINSDSGCQETIFPGEEITISFVNTPSLHEQPEKDRASLPTRIKEFFKNKIAIKPPVNQDPRLLSPFTKGTILVCLSFGSSLSGFCSTVYFPAIPEITKELNASSIGITLVSSLYILCCGISPIFWASISDYYHIRRFPCLIALFVFILASVGCALSNNVWILVVMRCLQSFGGSTLVSVGAGVVADCWEITQRGSAFSFLFIGQFLGPLIGPIVSGGMVAAVGWRSAFWLCVGYGLFLILFLFFFLPETYRQDDFWDQTGSKTTLVVDDAEAEEKAIEVKKSFNPLRSLGVLKYTFVLFTAIEIGFCFGSMFTLETLIPDLYYEHYSFNSWQTGLTFIGAGIANLLGSFLSGRLSDYFLARSMNKRNGITKAEDRITLNAWPGGFVFVPLGCLLFGWSIMANFSVWVAIVGFSILCFGMSQVFTILSAYVVDAVPGKGASVTAACVFFRMSIAAILSFISPIIGARLSVGYLTVLLGGFNVLGMSLLVYTKFKGIHTRRRAGFAPPKNQEKQ